MYFTKIPQYNNKFLHPNYIVVATNLATCLCCYSLIYFGWLSLSLTCISRVAYIQVKEYFLQIILNNK